jgi:hypothetical protein
MGRYIARVSTEADSKGSAMPINQSLIKHGIDDEEYQNAAPTIGETALAHFSTPSKHNDVLYQNDGLFFAMNPGRRLYLREAFPGEFDVWTTMEEFQQRPKLFVLVSLLSEGFHERIPYWRGRKFWKLTDSDMDVANAIIEMCSRGGLSVSDWLGFCQDQRIRKSDAAKHRSKRSVN